MWPITHSGCSTQNAPRTDPNEMWHRMFNMPGTVLTRCGTQLEALPQPLCSLRPLPQRHCLQQLNLKLGQLSSGRMAVALRGWTGPRTHDGEGSPRLAACHLTHFCHHTIGRLDIPKSLQGFCHQQPRPHVRPAKARNAPAHNNVLPVAQRATTLPVKSKNNLKAAVFTTELSVHSAQLWGRFLCLCGRL